MRKKIVAGNWKMNLTKNEALELYHQIKMEDGGETMMIVFSPALFLDALISQKSENVKIGAQNFYPQTSGAFTGEISYAQLLDLGVNYILIGHSERRMIFGETDEMIREKVNVAIQNKMNVMFCCGESLQIREENKHIEFVTNQLKNNLFQLSEEKLKYVTIAYEPIWAIGTGRTATPEQANEMHEQIRLSLAKQYSNALAESTSILYGGSCKPSNAKELFSQPHIDGGLIGGASLKSEEFLKIVKAF